MHFLIYHPIRWYWTNQFINVSCWRPMNELTTQVSENKMWHFPSLTSSHVVLVASERPSVPYDEVASSPSVRHVEISVKVPSRVLTAREGWLRQLGPHSRPRKQASCLMQRKTIVPHPLWYNPGMDEKKHWCAIWHITSAYHITANFCTCHDGTAAELYAKFYSDDIIGIWIRV